MYPGMLSAQLLGRLLPEIEKSSNIRDFSLTGFRTIHIIATFTVLYM
jgi:hypothetical protein